MIYIIYFFSLIGFVFILKEFGYAFLYGIGYYIFEIKLINFSYVWKKRKLVPLIKFFIIGLIEGWLEGYFNPSSKVTAKNKIWIPLFTYRIKE